MNTSRTFFAFSLPAIAAMIFFVACTKTAQQCDCINYPTGLTRIADPAATDCNLDRCDEKRTIVYTAEDSEGFVSGGIDSTTQEERYFISLSFPGSIDGQLTGDCCNELDRLKAFNGKKVRFSGVYRDGCGKLVPIYGGQDMHFLRLSKVDVL